LEKSRKFRVASVKIIIPIASHDEEIIKNFSSIKPLVKLGDKTMIEKFIENFKLNFEYIFLCKQKDLIDTDLLKTLKKLNINKKIVSINKDTTSAIETVMHAKEYIKKNDEVIICHPDNINIFFSKKNLIQKLKKNNSDGLLFAFSENAPTNTIETHTGRAILKNGELIQIIEKTNKTDNSLRLAGIYHFKKWSEFLRFSKDTFKNQKPVFGRYFLSQVYNEYLSKKKKINFNFLNLIPSCGEGSRFKINKEDNFKPLIKIDHKYMITKTINSLPKSNKNVVIMRNDHNNKYSFKTKIKKSLKNLEVLILKNKTSGMATTCYEYLKNYKKNNPILISSCDYAVVFDEIKLKKILDFFKPDVIVWTFKEYPDARLSPFAYAYCEVQNGEIKNISEKIPISDTPNKDNIVQGIFYFKSKNIFMKAFNKMIKKKNKINNEYYVGNSINELIKLNYKVIPFEVDQYICLGTMQDLKVYNFWSDFFYDKS
jgi:dTDP-glucose pyrophosphorylase